MSSEFCDNNTSVCFRRQCFIIDDCCLQKYKKLNKHRFVVNILVSFNLILYFCFQAFSFLLVSVVTTATSLPVDELLADNPKLTTLDINRILYRQFGTRIHRGTVSWNGETITLRESVVRQLHENYLESKGIVKQINIHQPRTEQPRQSPSSQRPLMDSNAGSKDANREYEVGHGMNVNDVDDKQSQQAKWRR